MDYPHEAAFKDIEEHLRGEYREVIIDFIIFNPLTNKILTQKRAADRRLFPGVWEFPGGLLQQHESLTACIQRTMYEECKMHLERIHSLVHVFTWDEDRDVATAQFLVEGTGTYVPQADMVSDWQYNGRDQIDVLLADGQTPIHRGAWYAFSYLEQPEGFASVLFLDKIISEFFVHLGIAGAPPKVRLGACKRFAIDTTENVLTVAPEFVAQYDMFAAANIILHQLYHNHCQGIASYQDVQAIRKLLGTNFMFYVDIVADMHTYLFLQARYGYSERDYLELCFKGIADYQSDTIEESKCSRLLGAALSIRFSSLASFEVVLPVIDSEAKRLAVLHFDKRLRYGSLPVPAATLRTLQAIFTGGDTSFKQYLRVIQQLADNYQKGYTS